MHFHRLGVHFRAIFSYRSFRHTRARSRFHSGRLHSLWRQTAHRRIEEMLLPGCVFTSERRSIPRQTSSGLDRVKTSPFLVNRSSESYQTLLRESLHTATGRRINTATGHVLQSGLFLIPTLNFIVPTHARSVFGTETNQICWMWTKPQVHAQIESLLFEYRGVLLQTRQGRE